MAKVDLTAQRLRELLAYDQETGTFTWRVNRRSQKTAGKRAGCYSNGYLRISIDDYLYLGHRLAWLHVHDVWPTGDTDHINGDRGDNRLANLRDVTRAGNIQNQREVSRPSRSGRLGVYRSGKHRWLSCITAHGEYHYLGTFDTVDEAHAAYVDAKRRLHATCSI